MESPESGKSSHDKTKDNLKSLKKAAGILSGIMFVLFSVSLYLIVSTRKSTVFLLFPVCLMPVLFGLMAKIKKIQSKQENG